MAEPQNDTSGSGGNPIVQQGAPIPPPPPPRHLSLPPPAPPSQSTTNNPRPTPPGALEDERVEFRKLMPTEGEIIK